MAANMDKIIRPLRERGREGGREGGRKRGREEEKEGGGREEGRETDRQRGKYVTVRCYSLFTFIPTLFLSSCLGSITKKITI